MKLKLITFTLCSLFLTLQAHAVVINSIPANQISNVVLPNAYPVIDDYKGAHGCYIACYSHDKTQPGGHAVGGNIYVVGKIRVPGHYMGSQCVPTNYDQKDISASAYFMKLCNDKITTCTNCWAGTETG